MSAYRTLAELLLEEAEAEPIISRIPTASRHEHHCRVILNQILSEDPGSCPLIISLCAYPVQSWADHMRNSLDLDLFSLQKFLEEKQESYCGIVRYSRLNLQKETLTDSAHMLHPERRKQMLSESESAEDTECCSWIHERRCIQILHRYLL